MRDFLWSKFWVGLVPVLALTEGLTITANLFLDIDPFLKIVTAVAVVFMSFALVGLATGFGARYPRFNAENASQIAGSPGGVAFMIVAVLYLIVMIALLGWPSSVFLWHYAHRIALLRLQGVLMFVCFATAAALSVTIWWLGMQSGVRALQETG